MNHMRGLWPFYISRHCPGTCRELNPAHRLAYMTFCRRHFFVVNSNDKQGPHWVVCAFDCRVRLELLTIWVWEPLSSTHLIRPFSMAMTKLGPNGRLALWRCGFQSLNIPKLVEEHRGTFFEVPVVAMGAGFVDYVLSIVLACRAVRFLQAPGDDVEGVTKLHGPP